jgi:hypothetical protein
MVFNATFDWSQQPVNDIVTSSTELRGHDVPLETMIYLPNPYTDEAFADIQMGPIICTTGICIRSSGLTMLTSYTYREWCVTNNFESGPSKDNSRSNFYLDDIDVISPILVACILSIGVSNQ